MPRRAKVDPPKPSVDAIRAAPSLTSLRDDDPPSCCNVCHLPSKMLGLWREHDDFDRPVEGTGAFVFIGKDHPNCIGIMERHPRLYSEYDGLPGYFPRLCGPCRLRDGFRCLSPNLKANGGAGLNVIPTVAIICGVGGSRRNSIRQRDWVECVDRDLRKPPPPVDAPLTLPSDRYVVCAVVDDQTCPTCLENNGCELLVPAGTAPAVDHCEHAKDPGSGRACRCTFMPLPR